jgi:hypothetical protein
MNMCGHFNVCLLLSLLGLSTSLNLNRCHFKWKHPVSSPIIILSRFLFKSSNFPALFTKGLLSKPLAFLHPWTDCHYALRLLLVKHLITSLAAFTGMPQAGSGLVSECDEPCLVNWLAINGRWGGYKLWSLVPLNMKSTNYLIAKCDTKIQT